jgi:PAS domain S-box-containing protein
MGSIAQFPWYRAFWPRMGVDEPANLLVWREQLARLMLTYGAIVLPLSMIYILPVFVSEKRYGLIAIDAVFWVFMICQVFVFRFPSRINWYLALGALYAMAITFVVSLGPFHARPAWLVTCTVFAGVLFGVRGTIAAALFDAAILMAFYGIMGPENDGWALAYVISIGNFIVFAFNTSLLALASGLTAAFLLNRLDRSLDDQRNAAQTLRKRSEDLEKAYGLLRSEMEQRKLAERALSQSEALLRRAQEIARLGSWELDLISNRLTWSDEVYRIFGLSPDEFDATYEAFLEAVHPDDRAAVDAAYSDSVSEGKNAYEIEHRVVRKSTEEIRVVHEKCEHIRDASGRIVRSIGMVQDITENKRAEEALRAAHERALWLARFPDENPNPVLRVSEDGSVLYCNPAAEELPGWASVVGRPLDSRLLPLVRYAMAEGQEEQEDVQIGAMLYSIWVTPFPEEGYANVYGRDVTERSQMEEALRRSRDELELRVQERTAELEIRNKELQDFAFVASHDLKEPLRKVQTFGRLLADKCAVLLDETSRDYIERMRRAAARMETLLNSLLSYSRVTTMAEPFKNTDLSKSVGEALSNLEIAIREKNAHVEVGHLPTVKADSIQMVQLFQNLIGNALKFSREDEAPQVKIYVRQVWDARGPYEICVEDNGIGFEERYIDKIFLPFQRLHGKSSEYGGVGMGLSICKKIVERHGGKITARSESGKGSTFIVTLPA